MSNLKNKWKKRQKLIFNKTGIVIPKYPTMTSGSGNYYNVTVDMTHLPSFPGDLACYCSTDHDATGQYDGIYMSYRKAGVWYTYDQGVANGDFNYLATKPAANPIYRDTVAGSQCETPFIAWVEDKFVLTYQMYGVGTEQSTLRALGGDGVNFTRDRVVLDYATGVEVGNGHTGYLRWWLNKFPGVNYKYVGYALHGGKTNGLAQMCGCNDPRVDNWTTIAILEKTMGDILVGSNIHPDKAVKWYTADVGSIRQNGRYWEMLCGVGTPVSGTAISDKTTYWVTLADDGYTVIGTPRLVIDHGGASDADSFSAQITTAVGDRCFYDAVTAANARTTAGAIIETSEEMEGMTKPSVYPPTSAVTTTFDFAASTSKPTGLTEVIETVALFDYATNVKITAAFDDGGYLFMDNGFIPNDTEFVEWWVEDIKVITQPTTRSLMIGFSSDKSKLSLQSETLMLSSGLEADAGTIKAVQRVNGAETNNEAITATWGYGWFSNYAAKAPKSVGVRWYPQLGLVYLLGASGISYHQITLNPSFDKSKTLYPFLGMRNVLTGYVSDETFKLARFKIKSI